MRVKRGGEGLVPDLMLGIIFSCIQVFWVWQMPLPTTVESDAVFKALCVEIPRKAPCRFPAPGLDQARTCPASLLARSVYLCINIYPSRARARSLSLSLSLSLARSLSTHTQDSHAHTHTNTSVLS